MQLTSKDWTKLKYNFKYFSAQNRFQNILIEFSKLLTASLTVIAPRMHFKVLFCCKVVYTLQTIYL